MGKYWNNDWVTDVIAFLEPVTGPICPEYLSNNDSSVMLEQLKGNPNHITFLDGRKIAKHNFALYVRCNGRGSADRRRATDILFAAAEKCAAETPYENAKLEMTGFPSLFNRNMSGMEEYRAVFSLYSLSQGTEENA